MMKSLSGAVLLMIPLLTGVTDQRPASGQVERPCREHPQRSGPPFTVHGALRFYNGSPSFRIWSIGTGRILGISEGRFFLEGYRNLPKWLEDQARPDSQVFADFVVFPFERDKPGVMRLVCVDTAYNVRVRPWR